jgi:hypothetical protein
MVVAVIAGQFRLSKVNLKTRILFNPHCHFIFISSSFDHYRPVIATGNGAAVRQEHSVKRRLRRLPPLVA